MSEAVNSTTFTTPESLATQIAALFERAFEEEYGLIPGEPPKESPSAIAMSISTGEGYEQDVKERLLTIANMATELYGRTPETSQKAAALLEALKPFEAMHSSRSSDTKQEAQRPSMLRSLRELKEAQHKVQDTAIPSEKKAPAESR